MRILLVEDDPVTQEFVSRGLSRSGFSVDTARGTHDGHRLAREGAHDVIVLDVMLPDGDGFALLAQLRSEGLRTPVLFLTARGGVRERLRGFELGADDYLPKPFAFAELVARLRAVALRRRDEHPAEPLRAADLVLDPRRRHVERDGRPIRLAPKEFALLEVLLRNRGVVLTRSMLVEKVWGPAFETRSNLVDVHIRALRGKIDAGFAPKLVHTVWGMGYVLEPRDDE
jgi:two-component system copper resistance phosphate regulon response regulator CusR